MVGASVVPGTIDMALVPKPCVQHGCTEYAYGQSRCDKHEKAFLAGRNKTRKANGRTGQRGTTAQWSKARLGALARDQRKCVKCGRTQEQEAAFSRSMQVHHIDGNPANDAISNLETLCAACHRLTHRQPAQN